MNVEGAGSIGITALYVNEKPKTGLGLEKSLGATGARRPEGPQGEHR